MKKVLREIFSGANGKLSAKRVIGGFAMAVALGCTIYLVIRDGSTSVVENLLMTIFITSVSLLGLPAVTSVWGSSKISVSKSEEKEETPVVISEQAKQDIPNCEVFDYNNIDVPVVIPELVKQDIPNCETCEYKNRHHC